MFVNEEYPEGGNMPSEPAAARPGRRRVHPITWVAAAALIPLLGWDVWQTLQDIKHRQAYASLARPPAAARLRGAFD
jgi:hypothetical protein